MGDFEGASPPPVEERMQPGDDGDEEERMRVEEEEHQVEYGPANCATSSDEEVSEEGEEEEEEEEDDDPEDLFLENDVWLPDPWNIWDHDMEQRAWRWHNAPENSVAPQVQGAGPPYPWWATSHSLAPNRPVLVGRDKDGGSLYVGRAWHMGHLLPAKVAPTHQGAFVGWAGKEHSKFFHHFEVLQLLRGRAEWLEASGGDVPAHAFPVGILMDGRSVFTARVSHDGTVTPGRVVENERYCYISYDGKELAFKNYEVLVIL